MSVSRYMSYCLGHPTLGYYARTRDQASSTVLGKQGDFITSPEISQVFGEVRFSSITIEVESEADEVMIVDSDLVHCPMAGPRHAKEL